MKFLIAPSLIKPEALNIARDVIKVLKQKNMEPFAEESFLPSLDAAPFSSISPHDLDFIVVLGGDGTILQHVRRYLPLTEAPIVGVNLGRLGFMADIYVEQIENRLQQLIDKKYHLESRLVLEITLPSGETHLAINDAVVHRGQNRSLIELRVEINQKYLNTFKADGYIVSTPTGSTAYSLAAGGSLITPTLDVVALTPICPHTLSNRPQIHSADEEVTIRYESPYQPVDVTIDGIDHFSLEPHQSIKIKSHPKKFQIVSFDDRDYFVVLREKFNWKGSPN